MVRRILALVLLLAPVPAMAAELALECCPSRCVGPACMSPGRGPPTRARAAVDLGIHSVRPGFKGLARVGETVSMIVAVRNRGRTAQGVTVAIKSDSKDDRVLPPPAQTVRPGTVASFTLRLKIVPRHTKGGLYERTIYLAHPGSPPVTFKDSHPRDNRAELRVEVARQPKALSK